MSDATGRAPHIEPVIAPGPSSRIAVAATSPHAPVRWSSDTLINPEPWVQEANCATTDPDAFFPEGKGGSARFAKQVCAECPVAAECLAYALRTDQRFGVWGGVTENARRKLAKQLKNEEEAS